MFFFVLWLPTSALLTPVAGVESRLALCYFFFLSFLALLEGSEFWVEVGIEALALDLSRNNFSLLFESGPCVR